MDRSDADPLNPQIPPVPEDNSRVSRHVTPPICGTSGLTSVIPIFCIGLVFGTAGGLLLGTTAVTVLQSLELLVDNTLFKESLEKHTMNEIKVPVHDIDISIFTEMFGVFSTALSLSVGLYIGLSTYSLVIKKKGKSAMGKALGLAGPVCLMGVTATGCILGLALEGFLSDTLKSRILESSILLWVLISAPLALITIITRLCFNSSLFAFVVLGCMVATTFLTPIAFIITSYLLKIRSVLVVVLIPVVLGVKVLEESHSIKMIAAPVPLILIISDVYYIIGQQIVSFQSPTFIKTNSVILEALFIGILASLSLTINAGMSLFVSWQRGGAGKICVSAAGSGAAVLGALKLALPVLGPGPTIGAVMGVSGAVGVSLSAAVAATDQYEGKVGTVGVTVGAAIGAFLSSCAHSGLSGMFMGLCAATFPIGVVLKLPCSGSISLRITTMIFFALVLISLIPLLFLFKIIMTLFDILIFGTKV